MDCDDPDLEHEPIFAYWILILDCSSWILRSNKVYHNSWQQIFDGHIMHIITLGVDWSRNIFSFHTLLSMLIKQVINQDSTLEKWKSENL